MAIKGKSKPKGGAKTVTRGPRPAYVPVHKPLFQRRSFWFTVLGVVVAASALGIWYGLAQQREADEEEALAESLAETTSEYQQLVDPIVATVGTPIPPSQIETFPNFETRLDGFIDGGTEAAALEDEASATSAAARAAAEDLEGIEVATLVAGKGFDEAYVLYMLNSQTRMVQGMRLYEEAALLASDAAAASGDAATGLATRAQEVLSLGKEIFAEGYQDYVEAQLRAGIYQPAAPTGVTP